MNIYLPENFVIGQRYPVIYATDGYELDSNGNQYAKILDSLIRLNIIPKMIYVEVYSNDLPTKEWYTYGNDTVKQYHSHRTFEYVEFFSCSFDTTLKHRFQDHMNYFVSELIPMIEQKFRLAATASNRYFYGYSNGAGFGANLAFKHPDLIRNYICFSSLGSHPEKFVKPKKKTDMRLYLKYGTLESEFFSEESENIYKMCKKYKVKSNLKTFVGDHDYRIWPHEFAKTLAELHSK